MACTPSEKTHSLKWVMEHCHRMCAARHHKHKGKHMHDNFYRNNFMLVDGTSLDTNNIESLMLHTPEEVHAGKHKEHHHKGFWKSLKKFFKTRFGWGKHKHDKNHKHKHDKNHKHHHAYEHDEKNAFASFHNEKKVAEKVEEKVEEATKTMEDKLKVFGDLLGQPIHTIGKPGLPASSSEQQAKPTKPFDPKNVEVETTIGPIFKQVHSLKPLPLPRQVMPGISTLPLSLPNENAKTNVITPLKQKRPVMNFPKFKDMGNYGVGEWKIEFKNIGADFDPVELHKMVMKELDKIQKVQLQQFNHQAVIGNPPAAAFL